MLLVFIHLDRVYRVYSFWCTLLIIYWGIFEEITIISLSRNIKISQRLEIGTFTFSKARKSSVS